MATNYSALPFEIGFEKARHDIANAINIIGRQYNIPSSILTNMIFQIAIESKMNALETIVANFDILNPNDNNIPDEHPDDLEDA